MRNQKNERGITLVALVVTIVVLLILAGITIMYVMQGDSIFNSANRAKTETNKGVVQEVVSTAVSELQMQLYTGKDADGNNSTLSGDTAGLPNVGTFISDYLKKSGMAESTNASCTKYGTDVGIAFTAIIEYQSSFYKAIVDTKAGTISVLGPKGTSAEAEALTNS